MFELMVEDTFDAAHALRNYEGPCERLHGHTWKVQVFLKGEKLKKEGFLLDFKEIKSALKEILKDFDHYNLNEIKYFKKQNPTSENVAKTIYELLSKKFSNLSKVTVWESGTTSASFML